MDASQFHANDDRRLRRMRWLTAVLLAPLGLYALGAVMQALIG